VTEIALRHDAELAVVTDRADAAVARLTQWAAAASATHKMAQTLVETSFVPQAFRGKPVEATGKENWQNQPQAMLLARATAECARLIAADAILGIPYAAEELRDSPELRDELAVPAGTPVTVDDVVGDGEVVEDWPSVPEPGGAA
jgi:hypothetical protein